MSITSLQKAAIIILSKKENKDKWISAFELKIGLNTLYSLTNKGLVESRNDLGSISSPLTCTKFRLKDETFIKPVKVRRLKRRVKKPDDRSLEGWSNVILKKHKRKLKRRK